MGFINWASPEYITQKTREWKCEYDKITRSALPPSSLYSPPNLSIQPCSATISLAITTLLKTGNESSVDRLMKQITNFMSDIADEFKIVVVEAIRSLCLKFPLKYRSL